MRHSGIIILFTSSLLLMTACGEETNKNNDDVSINNPVNTYLDSRVSAADLAKSSLKESNQRTHEQDKNIDALIGK